jgi:hypothetical protein
MHFSAVVARCTVCPLVDAIGPAFRPAAKSPIRPAASWLRRAATGRYHHRGGALKLAISASRRRTAPLVPDVWQSAPDRAAGGLAAAAVDLARFVAAFSVNRRNPMLNRTAILSMLNLAAHSGRPRAGHGFDVVTPIGSSYRCEKGGYLWTSQNTISFDLNGLGYRRRLQHRQRCRVISNRVAGHTRGHEAPRGRRGRTTFPPSMPAFR